MSLLLPGTAAAVERNLTPTPEPERLTGLSLQHFGHRIGVPLADHQAEALVLRRRITAVVAPRQAGKSRGVSVLALHRALDNDAHRTLIVSAGETAAVRLLDMIRRMALDADPAGAQLASESQWVLRFTNGSEIRCVPASERQIRGWTVDLLIIDEAALVDDDLILSAALPTTSARPSARIVLVSSPIVAAGAFYNLVIEGEQGSEHVESARWTLDQSPWISRETIAAARAQLPPTRFAAEYLGEFPETGAGMLIPRPLIRSAQERDLPGSARGAFGVDVARSGADFTTIYRNRGGVVRELARVHGNTTMQTAGEVARLMRATPAVPAVVDVVGIGAGVVDRLAEQRFLVVAYNAGTRARRPDLFANRRAEDYWRLRKHFEEGTIDIDPQDRELADELAALRYDTDSRGRVLMEGKDSMRSRGMASPDRADAIAMCVCAEPIDLTDKDPLDTIRRQIERSKDQSRRATRVGRGEVERLRSRPM